jgi:hypothetical protein
VLSYSFSFKTGIGAGLESMSTNSVGWEGEVNPRVRVLCTHCILIHVLCSCVGNTFFFAGN